MFRSHISTSSIQKLGHPIKEIRERTLLSVISKLKYGVGFEDGLDGLKKIFVYLLKWFEYNDSGYREEVLEALYTIFKSPLGHSLIKLIGSNNVVRNLLNLNQKIDPNCRGILENMIKFVKSYGDAHSKEFLSIPTLNMPSSQRSDLKDSLIDIASSFENSKSISKSDAKFWDESSCQEIFDLSKHGVTIYLMPWIHLCESDVQKILLNEESICNNSSFKRATYFFIHILLKDFPADVFLNRPITLKAFQQMINSSEFNILAVEALSAFCDSVNIRIRQFHDLSLKHYKKSTLNSMSKNFDDFENKKRYSLEFLNNDDSRFCDATIALNQLPLPIFCLETMYIIVNFLGQNVSELVVENKEFPASMNEINMAISLNMKLLHIFFISVENTLWKVEKGNRCIQEILQKQIQLLRICGDVLDKLRISHTINELKDSFYRIFYMRMLLFCISFAQWSDYSPVLPPAFISSLYNCVDDISFALIYPEIHEKLLKYLEFQRHDNLEDQNKLRLYIEIKKIAESMNSAIKILQYNDEQCSTPDIINTLKKSLISLEFHKNTNVINYALNIFCSKIPNWKLTHQEQQDIKFITLKLLSHSCDWVKDAFYANLHKVIKSILSGLIKTNDESHLYDESSLKFFFDSAILLEICCFGLEARSEQSRNNAQYIIQYLLKGKLLMTDTMWRLFLETILPSYPILNMYAAHDDDFGKSIIKTLDLKIGECMLIPKIDLIKGNIRLLYSKCFTAQMEGANNLLKFLQLEEGSDFMLPNGEFVRPDILCSALRTVKQRNFNINKPNDPSFYEEGALLKITDLLKCNLKSMTNDKFHDSLQVDPSICRSALSQLAIILQQINLHEIFVNNEGYNIVKYYLKTSLISSEFTTYPDSAISCISILNSLLYTNVELRQLAAEDINILFNIIRAILLFPNEDNFIVLASQTLSLLCFSNFVINSHESETTFDCWTNNLSIHNSIAKKANLPFKYTTHSKTSSYTMENKENYMLKQSASTYLRIHWSVVYFGGLNKVLNWPYIPDTSFEEEFNPQLMITNSDLSVLKETSPLQGCVFALYQIQNATSHTLVINGIDKLTGYILLTLNCKVNFNFDSLPWNNALRRFISAPPASPKDLSLLLHFMDFLQLYLKLIQNGSNIQDFSNIVWIIESMLEAPYGICALLKKDDEDDWDNNCDLFSYKLKEKILNLIYECCKYSNSELFEKFVSLIDGGISWKNVIYYLSNCLSNIEINNMSSLSYAAQILECLCHLLHSPHHGLDNDTNRNDQQMLINNLIHLSDRFRTNYEYHGYKGYSLIFNTLLILSRLIFIFKKDLKEIHSNIDENGSNILSMCLVWQKSSHSMLKCLSLKALSGIALSDIAVYLEQEYNKVNYNIIRIAVDTLADLTEGSILREQAAILLCNLLTNKSKRKLKKESNENEEFSYLLSAEFFDKMSVTLTDLCTAEDNIISLMGENISLDYLSNKEKFEVALSKKCLNKIPIMLTNSNIPKCTVSFAIQISNLIFNILNTMNEIPEDLHKSNVFKILFKCISLKINSMKAKFLLYASICKTLYVATALSHEILNTLLNLKDCMSALFNIFLEEFMDHLESKNKLLEKCQAEMFKWCYLLLGNFLETFKGYKCAWEILSKDSLTFFLHSFLISLKDQKYSDIIPASLYCFVSFINTYTSCLTNDNLSLEDIFDTVLINKKNTTHKLIENNNISPRIIFNEKLKFSVRESNASCRKDDENPNIDVLGEEFCYYLMKLYQDCNYIDNLDNRINVANFDSIASGLCVILGISSKARMIAIDCNFIESLIDNLNEIQYYLMTHTKPQSILRSKKKSPVIHYLNWTILLLCNTFSNCEVGKNICADHSLIVPINKLWPWIISDEVSRQHTIQMLLSYTNSCSKSSHSMCITVGTNSLLAEVIDLVMKEMSLVSRSRSLVALEGCLEILKNVSNHIHCRAIIVKSEVFSCLNKLHPAITKRQVQWKKVEIMWESFCMALSMYPEGQSKIGEHLSTLCAFVNQSDCLMLSVLRNCAFCSLNRPKYLGSAELLHTFSNILSSPQRLLADKTNVCKAIWALCANNHKSKLSLKTAGITSRLAECLHRSKSLLHTKENDCEIQIMIYVLNIMNR